MEQLQRMVLLLGVCLVLLSSVGIRQEQNRYYIETWTEAETTYFFEKLCREGECLTEDLSEFMETLSLSKNTESIRIEEYQRVLGPDGTEYRYLSTWEEIQEKIEQDGRYRFFSESEIRLYLGEKVYYGQVKKRRK